MKKITEKIIAITSYPPRGETHGEQVVGIASYAKNTIRSIMKNKDKKSDITMEVMAEKLEGEEDYNEGKVAVKRVWKRNSFSIFPSLLRQILSKKNRDAKTILLEFELSMFGNFMYLAPFPIFLLILKLLGKKIVFVCHQVIPDFEEIAPHINLSHKSFQTDVMNFSINVFYKFMISVSSRVIVFEEDLKEKLTEFGTARKITVIPHGVEEFKIKTTKEEARRKLKIKSNSYVVLSFGFIAWYKGTDWLVHAMESLKKNKKLKSQNVQLVLAGGPNPNHEDRQYYKRYMRGIENACRENGFLLTGFVPEEKIALYFQASDLVVLPYRTFMSASGPLSITFSFKKPFLLSPKLSGILESDDFASLLKKLNLKESDIVFHDFNGDLGKKVSKLRNNPRLVAKMKKLSASVSRARSWDKIGEKYYDELLN